MSQQRAVSSAKDLVQKSTTPASTDSRVARGGSWDAGGNACVNTRHVGLIRFGSRALRTQGRAAIEPAAVLNASTRPMSASHGSLTGRRPNRLRKQLGYWQSATFAPSRLRIVDRPSRCAESCHVAFATSSSAFAVPWSFGHTLQLSESSSMLEKLERMVPDPVSPDLDDPYTVPWRSGSVIS